MPDYSASITDSDIFVGKEAGNHFSIEISPSNADLKNVIVRVSIPFGPDKAGDNTFLLKDESARPTVSYRLSGDSGTPVKIDRLSQTADPAPEPNHLAWELPSKGITIAAGNSIVIDIGGLSGSLPPGTAKVTVGIRSRGPARKNAFTDKILDVDVALQPGDEEGVKIHYFDVSRDYVLHAGEEEVVLSWHATSAAKEVTLFKNNEKIWPPHGGSDALFFKDRPSITSVYRLEAFDDTEDENKDRAELLKNKKLVVRPLTVQVAQAGWNRQPLHQGYPTVLMKALSFSSGEAERLYGVFVEPKTGAIGLYSSATGFPPWRMESGGRDFKDIFEESGGRTHKLRDMSHSPSVACDGKLWLIGGSSVDPSKTSNEVWYYQKAGTTNEAEWVRDSPGPFPKRMGHCVVQFNDKIWVMGGSDGTKPLRDVWSYDYNTGTWQGPSSAGWPARCMFSAVKTPVQEDVPAFKEEKLWVYGGRKDPDIITAKTDLWSTKDGANWKQETTFELGPLAGQPNGATLFCDDGLHLAGTFKAATRTGTEDRDAGATLSAMVYSSRPDRFLWEANPVSWGWEQFGGDAFLMQSIVFNRFWFFWSLNQSIKHAPKLNVFIPS